MRITDPKQQVALWLKAAKANTDGQYQASMGALEEFLEGTPDLDETKKTNLYNLSLKNFHALQQQGAFQKEDKKIYPRALAFLSETAYQKKQYQTSVDTLAILLMPTPPSLSLKTHY